MNDFKPVDHKETNATYVAQIRQWVEQRANCDLLATFDPQGLVGIWKSSIDFGHGKPFDYEFRADGTYLTPISFEGPTPNTWRIDGDRFIETSWSPPIPECDIHEPMQGQECYRCGQLADGRFAYWNGDSSLLVFLTRCA